MKSRMLISLTLLLVAGLGGLVGDAIAPAVSYLAPDTRTAITPARDLDSEADEVYKQFRQAQKRHKLPEQMEYADRLVALRTLALEQGRAQSARLVPLLTDLAWAHFNRGDIAAIDDLMSEAQSLARDEKERRRLRSRLCYFRQGLREYGSAAELAKEALAEETEPLEIAHWEVKLGHYYSEMGDHSKAMASIQSGLGRLQSLEGTKRVYEIRKEAYYALYRASRESGDRLASRRSWTTWCEMTLKLARLSEGQELAKSR